MYIHDENGKKNSPFIPIEHSRGCWKEDNREKLQKHLIDCYKKPAMESDANNYDEFNSPDSRGRLAPQFIFPLLPRRTK